MCEWSNISTASMFCIAVNLNIENGCLGLGSTSWSKTNLTRIHLNHALKSNKYFQCMIGKTYTVFWYFPSYLSELIYFLPTMQYKIKQSRWCPMLIILQVPLSRSPSSLYWCPHYLDCLLSRPLDKTFCSNGKISYGTFTLYKCKLFANYQMVPLFDFARQKRWSNDVDWW